MKWMTGLLQNGVRPGDTLMLLDAIVYALYSVQLKRRSLLRSQAGSGRRGT
jgi:hypothetical protein